MPLETKNRLALNGVDCLMLAFDRQLKKNGFAGNLAQIVLGLDTHMAAEEFQKRLAAVASGFPVIRATLKSRFWKGRPFWLIPVDGKRPFPEVRTHVLEAAPGSPRHEELRRRFLNTPLRTRRGEWIRFDLVYFSDRRMEITMTWHHVLMDARGAEYFLHLIGGGAEQKPLSMQEAADGSLIPFYKRLAAIDMKEKWRLAGRAFERIDGMALLRPVSLYTRLKSRTRPRLDYRLESFSLPETREIMVRCREICGPLNDSAYFLSAALLCLADVHRKKNVPTRSYIVSFPVDLRKIGTRLPLFTNQAGTLLYEFKAGELTDISSVAGLFRSQTQEALRRDLLFANFCVQELSRFLPTWFYVRKIKKSLRGEIASLVFANPGATFQGLAEFLEQPVRYQYHVPAVVAPPGIGVVYYFFNDRLQITLVYAEGMLTAGDAGDFLTGLRGRLLTGQTPCGS
ncbi:MAG: hypothetical protein ACOZF0_15760 [Thermodesulfobacteriota bacterium]